MFDALYIGATGMRGQQMQIDAIAQNVANINTVGYRRSAVSFAEITAALANAGRADPTAQPASAVAPTLIGAGALPMLQLSMFGGELRATGEALNVAIDGAGFLEVLRADGTPAYTRAGQLKISPDGMLSTLDGAMLSARIQVSPDARELRIDTNGVVSALVGERVDAVELGRVNLATFANPSGLTPLGDNLYGMTAQSGNPQFSAPGENGTGSLRQGFLEGSSVQMTDELVNLMLAQRAFELNSKVMQVADQLFGITNGLAR